MAIDGQGGFDVRAAGLIQEFALKHILAALDLDARAGQVFGRAVQLAVQHGSKLTLAHVAAYGEGAETSDEAAALVRAEEKLHELSKPVGLEVDLRVVVGNPAHEIATLVRETGADLVVMGAHRQDPIVDLYFETTAYYTIEGCNVPLLIVKNPAHGAYLRVLAPTDFSSCARRALHAALMIAPLAEFHVLHVYEAPLFAFLRFNEEQLERLHKEHISRVERDVRAEMRNLLVRHADQSLPEVKIAIERGEVDARIAKAVERLGPDLMAMGMSGRGLAALIGSRTKEYLKAPFCDLIVTP